MSIPRNNNLVLTNLSEEDGKTTEGAVITSGTHTLYGTSDLNLIDIKSENIDDTNTFVSRMHEWIIDFKIQKMIFNGLIVIVMPSIVWLFAYILVGPEDLPGGSVFVIIVLEFGGRILGTLASFIQLPPMVGMLGLGILIRNVPYLDFGKYMDPALSSPLRQIALAVILTRAGLGLDLDTLKRLKSIIFRLAVFPTVIEALSVALTVHFIIGFPWAWSFLVGFVVAAVSPAVVVPRILQLREQGFGVEKGVPTIILAAASLDNVVAISLFGVTLGFVFSNKSVTESILQGPLEILMGLVFGTVYGGFLGLIFNRLSKEDNNEKLLRMVLTLLGGAVSVIGFHKLGFTGAGALGCLIMAFVASCLWRKRGVRSNSPDSLTWAFTLLWLVFEPLLFGVIGCQIDISKLDLNVLLLGLVCLSIGTLVRFVTTFLMSMNSGMNIKERIFMAIAWVPKATVQAAIGQTALDMAETSQDKEYGNQVLTLAVLVILLTAVLGEMAVIKSGPKLLTKKQIETPSVA